MASTLAVLLFVSSGLFTVTVGFSEDCKTSTGLRLPALCGATAVEPAITDIAAPMNIRSDPSMIKTSILCCGLFTEMQFAKCIPQIVVAVIVIIVFITCCCCPCCCIYKMCKNPRPVVGTQVTTVMNMQCIQQQPVMQGGQYPQYQPVPTQLAYGGQPVQTGPYQGQPYAPGPPPPYHVAMSPGYPTSQSAYDGGQAMYPMQPPAQPGVAYMPSETSNQPAYNPAYVQPPNTGY